MRERILAAKENLNPEEAMEIIEEVVFADGEELDLSQLHSIIRKIYARTRSKFGILEEYIEDESINEIMINGKDHFFLETGGDMDGRRAQGNQRNAPDSGRKAARRQQSQRGL